MVEKIIEVNNVKGLSSSEVVLLQRQYGRNIISANKDHYVLRILTSSLREPMFILLAIACALYFILGNISEGIMMAVAMLIVTAISFYQEVKSSRALKSLREFMEPMVTVIRNETEQRIK